MLITYKSKFAGIFLPGFADPAHSFTNPAHWGSGSMFFLKI